MIMKPLIIRKRIIDNRELDLIQATVTQHWAKGRTHISRILCQKWNWTQPNGRLKDMACREVLLTLYRKGLITLPPAKFNPNNKKRNRHVPLVKIDKTPICKNISGLANIELKMVRHTDLEPLYNSLIQEHHYLGYCQIVGNHLKYIVFADGRPVACLGWGSAAWSVKSREVFIGWSKPVKEKHLHFVANNTRFLIPSWIQVKCLASKILALNAKRISQDWLRIYHYPLYLLETFVEQNRFKGTSYQAANWIRVGQTKGTAKRGHDHLIHGKIKDVYLYPLRKDSRKKLMG